MIEKIRILIGPYNLSGNWSGVMGDVVTGKYPIGLSTWRWTIERHIVGDFNVILSWDYKKSYLVLQRPQIDPEFFTRSFSNLSWLYIISIFLSFPSCYRWPSCHIANSWQQNQVQPPAPAQTTCQLLGPGGPPVISSLTMFLILCCRNHFTCAGRSSCMSVLDKQPRCH